MVSGRYDDSGHQRPGWYIYKAGWVVNPPTGATPEEKAQYVDDLGRPKIFQWEITINPNMEHVDNVVLTDTLGPGQHFDTSRGLASTLVLTMTTGSMLPVPSPQAIK